MDGLPWPTITAAAGGWTLFGLAALMLLTGKGIVSSREAQSYLTRAEKAEENNATLTKTLAELTAVGRLQKALVTAQQQAAEQLAEDDSGPPDRGE